MSEQIPQIMFEGWTAEFLPQAWIDGIPLPVDLDGRENEWSVSADYLEGLVGSDRDLEGQIISLQDLITGDSVESDDLRFDPAAPVWLEDHKGPFACRLIGGPQFKQLRMLI